MLRNSKAIELVLDGSSRCLGCQQGNCTDREELHNVPLRENRRKKPRRDVMQGLLGVGSLTAGGRTLGLIYEGIDTPHNPPRREMRGMSIRAIHESPHHTVPSSLHIKHNKQVERRSGPLEETRTTSHGGPRCVHASFVLIKTETETNRTGEGRGAGIQGETR